MARKGKANKAEIWQNQEKLRNYLGLESVKDLQQWMSGPLFKPAFKELFSNYISKVKQAGSGRTRGPDLQAVEATLYQGQSAGKRKFSAPGDRSGWGPLEHLARFLWWVQNENVEDQNGIFFNKRLPDAEIHGRIWMVFQRAQYQLTPSPSRVPKAKPTRVEAPPERISARIAARGTSAGPIAGPSSASSSALPHTSPSHQLLQETEQSDVQMGGAPVERDFIEHEDESDELKVLSGQIPESKLFICDDEDKNLGVTEKDDESADDIEDYDPVNFTPLRTERRLELEKFSATPDWNDKYWVFFTVSKLCNIYGDVGQCRELLDKMYNCLDPRLIAAESMAWVRELNLALDTPEIQLTTPTNATTERFFQINDLLDNVNYQREDHAGACERLEIVDPKRPRLRSMARGKMFKFWQPTAIDALLQWGESDLNGCVLGDDMGLGKTIVVAGYFLRKQELRAHAIALGKEVPPARPSMVVCPAALIDQWIADLTYINPEVRILLYYGHYKSRTFGHPVEKIEKRLTKESSLFDGSEENAGIIILTSPATLARRHGPAAQVKWHIDECRMPREYAQAAGKRGELSNAFPWRLDNVIGDLVLDEAHFAKNIQSNTHGSIAWLRARFLILVSATPCINHIRDFTGFLHLIQPKNLWSKANLEKLGIDEHTNIYADSFNDDRPGYEEIRRLRYTAFGYMKWIANENNPTTASHYLSQVWKKCFLRRTYTSRIPFNTGRQIGAEIPPMHTTCLETSFTMEEQKQYDPLRQMLQAQLAKRLESGKIVWNMKTFRRLILLGTWLGLDYCEQSMPSARTGKLLADPHTIWRLLQMCHQRDPEQFPMVDKRDHPALIAAVLRDSPKLRALVKVVSRQVLVQGEKAIIWVLFPAQQVLITKLFQLLNIDARALNRSLEYEARRDLIRDFQETTNKCMVLIPTYFMGSYGQNFQFQCHNTHLFDPAPSDPIRLQAIHRCRRIQQLFYVIVVEYYLSYSFNDYHYAHNIRKALPGVMAELNSRLIAGSDGDDVGDEVVLGKWAIYGGRLTPFAEIPMDVADKVIVLDAESLVRAILEEQHGERVVVEEKEEFSWLTAE